MNEYSGFTLLEVLIALIILSAVLTTLNSWQIYFINRYYGEHYHALSIQHYLNLNELKKHEFSEEKYLSWQADIARTLPNGHGVIQNKVVVIAWNKPVQDCHQTVIGKAGCLKIDYLV